jgi:hypothetical protein
VKQPAVFLTLLACNAWASNAIVLSITLRSLMLASIVQNAKRSNLP